LGSELPTSAAQQFADLSVGLNVSHGPQQTLVIIAANARSEPLKDIVCEKRDVRFVP
jgi:hypothetical protein